jgi:hypothetical protein
LCIYIKAKGENEEVYRLLGHPYISSNLDDYRVGQSNKSTLVISPFVIIIRLNNNEIAMKCYENCKTVGKTTGKHDVSKKLGNHGCE